MKQEISTDYANDDDDPLDSLKRDVQDCQQLASLNQQLHLSHIAVEAYGINKVAMSVLQKTTLLQGTALARLGLESIHEELPGGPMSTVATEALLTRAKETAGRWAVKVINFGSRVKEKVDAALDRIWAKIEALYIRIKNPKNDPNRQVNTESLKTALKIVGTVVAVAGVIAWSASRMPGAYANESALQSFMYALRDKINQLVSPIFKTKATASGTAITVLVDRTATDATTDSAARLGWVVGGARMIFEKLKGAWGLLRRALSSFGGMVVGLFKKVNDINAKTTETIGNKVKETTHSPLAGFVTKMLTDRVIGSVIGAIFVLLKDTIITSFNKVKSIFVKLQQRQPEPA